MGGLLWVAILLSQAVRGDAEEGRVNTINIVKILRYGETLSPERGAGSDVTVNLKARVTEVKVHMQANGHA